MKTKVNGIIIKGLIITMVLITVPMLAAAMGNSDRPYPEVLEAEFTDIAIALEAGDIDMDEALEQLHTLRTEYNREDNEDYQAMEGLLLAVQTRTMVKEQALVQLRQLNECKDEGSELKTQEQLKIMTHSEEQSSVQTQSGKTSGGSQDKAKGKK